ncbi:MAG TPA: ABC transporter permease [Vicinamibacterales bacterium]|nr:ABC transporter permease [Vicinamibacterales bacterium]
MSLLKDAVRGLRAAPIVSVAAILSLALGIGATTAMFSLLDALMLRSLPIREPARLMFVQFADDQTSLTNPLWEALQARQTGVFESSAAWGNTRFDLAKGGEAVPANGMFVSGSFFDTLGVHAAAGRTLTSSDDRRGGGPDGPVAVISHDFWQRHFGGAADIVGRSLLLQRIPYTVVGVIDPRFTGPDVGRQFDVAVPLGTEPVIRGADSALDARSSWWLNVVARLEPGVSPEESTARLNARQPQIREATLPQDWRPEELKHYLSEPFSLRSAAAGSSSLRSRYAKPLTTMMGAVALVLLIACANIANLLLARADARRRELSVRLALGASRSRLALYVFAESVVLAAIGALAGLLVAQWGSALLVSQLSTQVNTVFLDVSPDWRVLAFTTGLAGLTAIIFGTVPALRAGRVRAGEVLIGQSRGVAGQGQGTFGAALVVTQVALSLILVVGAGVFVRTFASLAGRDLGFQTESVLITSVNASRSNVPPEARAAHFERIRQAVLAVPGVLTASGSVVTPVSGNTWQFLIEVPDRPDLPKADRTILVNLLQPDWFKTYQTPFVAGRDFTSADGRGAAPVVILNEAASKKLFGDQSPIGKTIREPGRGDDPTITMEVIGVVRDAVYRSLRDAPPSTMYKPLAQQPEPSSFVSMSIRAAQGSPLALTKAVTAAVQQVDADASLTFRALEDQVNGALIQERLLAMLSGFFAALALLLAGLGLYGVTAYAVNRRRVEMSIRMALGSTPSGVIALVLRRVAWLVGLGVLMGGAGSYWATSLVSSLMWGVKARDIGTLAVAVAVLASVGAIAGWLPARRASRLDPGAVLRE